MKKRLNGTRTTKSNWFGTCSICGGTNKKLMTTQTSSNGLLYWIKRACQHCQDVIQNEIHHAVIMVRADQRQLDENKKEPSAFVPHMTKEELQNIMIKMKKAWGVETT